MTEFKIAMEQSRTAFNNFSMLCTALKDYSYDKSDEQAQKLKNIIKLIRVGMPLPSGRYGNALAVALEMQLYQGALLIIENAEELEIDLNHISSELGGKNAWGVKDTFLLSQVGFDKKKIEANDNFYKDFPWFIESNNANIDAASKIEKLIQEKMESKTMH